MNLSFVCQALLQLGPSLPQSPDADNREGEGESVCVFNILHKKGPHTLLYKDMQGLGEHTHTHTHQHTHTYTDGVQQQSWCKSSQIHRQPINLQSWAEVHSQFNRWLGRMGHEIRLSVFSQLRVQLSNTAGGNNTERTRIVLQINAQMKLADKHYATITQHLSS